jgi:cbb3-type cytochrome oxidase subunit 3
MVFEPEVIEKGKWISLICFGLFILLSGAGIYFLYRKETKDKWKRFRNSKV